MVSETTGGATGKPCAAHTHPLTTGGHGWASVVAGMSSRMSSCRLPGQSQGQSPGKLGKLASKTNKLGAAVSKAIGWGAGRNLVAARPEVCALTDSGCHQ